MADLRKNFAYSTVATAPSPATSGTSLTVASGEGARFPTAPFNLTVWPTAVAALPSNAEIVRVTARTGDVLTITRAQEGTTARTIVAGDQIAQAITDEMLWDLEPFTDMVRNRVALCLPGGNSTTVPTVIGMGPLTYVGTVTARNIATTNSFTMTQRIGYVAAATAGSLVSARLAAAQVRVGGLGGSSGFRVVTTFGCSDAATVAGARQFVGMSNVTTAPTNVEPSTLTNCVGVGHGAADTNLKLYYGGSTAQTPIDLGANFPANTLSVDMYELELVSYPDVTTVEYTVKRLNTGHIATGTLSLGTAGVTLPATSTLLTTHRSWRTNNATALAVALDWAAFGFKTRY